MVQCKELVSYTDNDFKKLDIRGGFVTVSSEKADGFKLMLCYICGILRLKEATEEFFCIKTETLTVFACAINPAFPPLITAVMKHKLCVYTDFVYTLILTHQK